MTFNNATNSNDAIDDDFCIISGKEVKDVLYEQAKTINQHSISHRLMAEAHKEMAEAQKQMADSNSNLTTVICNLFQGHTITSSPISSGPQTQIPSPGLQTQIPSPGLQTQITSPGPQTQIPSPDLSTSRTFSFNLLQILPEDLLHSAKGVPVGPKNWFFSFHSFFTPCHICSYYGHGLENCPNITISAASRCIQCWEEGHNTSTCSAQPRTPPYKPRFISRITMASKVFDILTQIIPTTETAIP